MNRPLVIIVTGFIAGIVIGSFLDLSVWFGLAFAFVFMLLAVLAFKTGFKSWTLLFICFACLGAARYAQQNILPQNHISKFTPSKSIQVVIQGRVIDMPKQKKNKNVFTLLADKFSFNNKTYHTCGKVLVWDFSRTEIKHNDQVLIQGSLFRPFPFRLSGKLNYRDYLAQKKIFSQLNVKKKDPPLVRKEEDRTSISVMAFKVNRYLAGRFDKHLSLNSAGILKAMLLGQRGDVPESFETLLRRTGTVHVLAVSGLHTGMIVLIILLLLRMLMVPFKPRHILGIILLIFYCFITGFRISVLRAAVMASVYLFSFVIDRDYDAYSSLAFSAMLILWFMPAQLFEVGFQLSFVSVLSIIIFYGSRSQVFKGLEEMQSWQKNLWNAFWVSLCAWLGTLGLAAYHFSIISFIAVFANLVLIPLLFLLIVSGIMFLILGSLSPVLAGMLALNCEFFVAVIYKINALLAGLPLAYIETGRIQQPWVWAYYFILFVIVFKQKVYDIISGITKER